MFKYITLCSITAIAISSHPILAAEETIILEPINDWGTNHSKDSCAVSRSFGTADSEVTLYMTRFYPSDHFDMVIVGDQFDKTTSRKPIAMKFGPLLEEQKLDFKVAYAKTSDNKDVKVLVITPTMRVAPYSQQELINNISTITRNDERSIQYISIKAFRTNEIILNTDSMSQAFAELRNCTNTLVKSWGYDPEQQNKLTRGPKPINNPQNWVIPTDYPLQQLQNKETAAVQFRLHVNEKGETVKCSIQRSIGDEAFNKAVCRALMKRAKFEPALDEYGQPIASYFANKVTFIIP